MKYFILTLSFVIISSISYSQITDNYVEAKIDSITNPHEKIIFLNQWVTKNYRKKPKKSHHYINICIDLASNNNNDFGYAVALSRLALFKQNIEHNYDVAINLYNKANAFFIKNNNSYESCLFHLNRGCCYLKLRQFDLAIKDFFHLLKLSQKRNDLKFMGYAYNNLGLAKKNLTQYNQALIYYKKAINILTEIKNYKHAYSTNNNIANIYSILGNYNDALEYYKANITLLKNCPSKIKQAKTYHNIGTCFLEMKNYDLALEYLKLSLQLKDEIGNDKFCISTYNSIGHAYYNLNKIQKSLSFYKKSFKIATKYSDLNYTKNCSREIFKCYTYLNQPDSTIKYFNIYNTTKDSIIQRTNLKQIAEIETKYETEKKESQIVLLEKENQRKIIERNSIFVLFLLLLSYVVFIVRSYYKNKKQTRMLSLQNNRIGWHGELLRRKNIDLEESNQTKNKLFQIISHDLRSPLASVSGISKLIPMFIQMEKYNELEDTSKDLEDSVSRVLNLTDNLLSWSMNQSGRLPFKPCVISLHNILSGIIETYQSVAQQKKIHLQLITNENMFIRADRPMFETVIRNLLNNAIKFTPCGGVIILGAEEKNNYTEIWLKDSGTGIPADQLPHLFEISNTKSHYGTEGERGSGLGLLLCKDFIEKNKGNIRVESIVEEGSTFTISIPTAQKIVSEKEELAYT